MTNSASYTNIRNLFNSAISGPNVNAILLAISVGDEIVRQNSANLYLNMFVQTAVGPYLDTLGNNSGIERPPEIGISDLAYSQIISKTINQQNDLNSLLNILDIYFAPQQTHAYVQSANTTPFSLTSGDNLTLLIDDVNTYNLVFNASDFNNINSISALDLANAITAKLDHLNSQAYAQPSSVASGALNQVSILSNTLGPKSSIQVIGGKANNTLKFSTYLNTTQNNTTQFNIQNYKSSVAGLSGTTTRFTWSGGTNPGLTLASSGDYVNIFGNEFNALNTGTYTINNVVNGPVNYSYFEVTNIASVTQSVTLTNASDINFFNPVRRVVGSDLQYASIYEAINNQVQIFIPASTSVVARTPTTGGGYMADEYVTIIPSTNVSFTLGENIVGKTSKATGFLVSLTTGSLVLGDVYGTFVNSETLLGETTGVTTTISSFTKSLDDQFHNDYIVDFSQPAITKHSSNLSMSVIANQQLALLTVNSTANFSVTGGYLVIDLGYDGEENVIRYETVLTANTILLDATYQFQYSHAVGADVTFIASKSKYQSPEDGSDLPCYLTDVATARQSAIDSLSRIESAGLVTNVTVLYPGSDGLPQSGSNDIEGIYGE